MITAVNGGMAIRAGLAQNAWYKRSSSAAASHARTHLMAGAHDCPIQLTSRLERYAFDIWLATSVMRLSAAFVPGSLAQETSSGDFSGEEFVLLLPKHPATSRLVTPALSSYGGIEESVSLKNERVNH